MEHSRQYAAGHLLYCLSLSAVIHSTAPCVPCDTSSSLVTHRTLDTPCTMLTGVSCPQTHWLLAGYSLAMCCVGVCVLPLRDRSNVDCQVPRQPWPLLCRELPCWPGPGAAYTYTLVHSVHPHSRISITLLLAIEARLPPTNLRDATIS